jgi:hypothetical protein
MKNLHFTGAFDFQIGLAQANFMVAMKKRLYAVLTEKAPSAAFFQITLSASLFTRVVSLAISQRCKYWVMACEERPPEISLTHLRRAKAAATKILESRT